MRLRAPFPYFGGKSAIAAEIWRRLGTGADAPRHYIEPFAGSLAVLLARPDWQPGVPWVETINDLDGLLINVWRALAMHPDEVARHARWPVSELDLHARHSWLRGQRESITERLRGDPDWCDPRAAGWWLWGAACWIGSGWASSASQQLPAVGRPTGSGILSVSGPSNLQAVAERVSAVRAVCGDWRRPLGRTTIGACRRRAEGGAFDVRTTAIYLDPPYGDGTGYAVGENVGSTACEVWAWAIDAAYRWPELRIAVSGYDDGRTAPEGWETFDWDANSRQRGAGYGNHSDGQGRENARRERVWFSPGCIKPAAAQMGLPL